ncbi:MAG: hypothetical protein EON54_23825, partial [Alcaligenaceae bacterium]
MGAVFTGLRARGAVLAIPICPDAVRDSVLGSLYLAVQSAGQFRDSEVDGFAARASRRPPVIKVLHVFKTFFPDTYGGIEQVVRTLAENAAAQGIDCRVLVLSPQGSSTTVEPSGYTLIRCQTTVNVASTGFSWAFFHQFRQHADWADIVHVHYPWPFIDLTVLLRGCKTPMVMTYHSDIVNQTRLERFYAPLRDWFLRKQKRIVATSP